MIISSLTIKHSFLKYSVSFIKYESHVKFWALIVNKKLSLITLVLYFPYSIKISFIQLFLLYMFYIYLLLLNW